MMGFDWRFSERLPVTCLIVPAGALARFQFPMSDMHPTALILIGVESFLLSFPSASLRVSFHNY
jgi:hypothetical protein